MTRLLKGTFLSILFFLLFGQIFLQSATCEEYTKTANCNVESKYQDYLSDPLKPIYHLRAPSGWINDPCGLFYYNSSFHVFCQSNPWGDEWGNMSWSHMVSYPDKKWNFKWFYPLSKERKMTTTAILPSLNINAPDKDGIFTGCIKMLPFKEKNDKNQEIVSYYPTAFYSAVWGTSEKLQEVVCMARALDAGKVDKNGDITDPYLTKWTKFSKDSDTNSNPAVIINQPESLNLVSFRDPYVFTMPDDNSYYMLLSGGIINKNGTPEGVILLYSNDGTDLTRNWELMSSENNFFFAGSVEVKDSITHGGDFECAAVYRLTDHIGTTNETPYILIFGQDGSASDYGKSLYYVLGGILKTENSMKFIPLDNFKGEDGKPIYKHLDLNPEFVLYASQPMPVDNEQRHYLFAWLNIPSQSTDNKKYHWSGMLSIPRFLFSYRDGNGNWSLGQEAALVTALRSEALCSVSDMFSKEKNQNSLDLAEVKGLHLNIETKFSSEDIKDSTFGLKVNCSENKYTDIKIDKGVLSVGTGKKIDLKLPNRTTDISLNVFLDGSSLEIFLTANDSNNPIQYDVFSSALPNNGKPDGGTVLLYGSNNVSVKADVYDMESCWVAAPESN